MLETMVRLLLKDDAGDVMFPVHDACIKVVQNFTRFQSGARTTAVPSDHALLRSHYEAFIRLYDRLTTWPYNQPELVDQLERTYRSPGFYGYGRLEWEHCYYNRMFPKNAYQLLVSDCAWEVRSSHNLSSQGLTF